MQLIRFIAWGCMIIGLAGFLVEMYTGLSDGLFHIIPFLLVGVAMEAVYQELKVIHKKK